MINTPKIAFAYPTFIRPGMSATGPFLPDIGWQVGNFPAKMPLYVSVGLMLNSKAAFSYDIDVMFEGKSLTPDDAPVIDSNLLATAVSNRDDFVAVSTNLIESFTLPSAGAYSIKVRLFAGTADSSEKEVIDECLSYFTLAESWINNEMKKTD